MKRTYALLAAEPSGDLQAAALVPYLRELDPEAEFIGMGGKHLESQGVELLCDTSWWASIGATEVLTRLPRIILSYYLFRYKYARRNPDVTVMIDSPAVFMRLAKFARSRKLKTVYYFPPSAWSDNPNRMKQIAERVTGVVATFRRSWETYQASGIPVQYFGHPMVDVVKRKPRAQVLAELGLKEGRYVTLLPGSRQQEIRLMTPILLETAQKLKSWDPNLCFLLPAASSRVYEKLQGLVPPEVFLYSGKAQEMLSISELAVMTSGSVSLEAAFLDCPMVLGYRFNKFDIALGRFLVRTGILKLKHFALPNLVLDETILPELLQEEVTAERLFEEAKQLLPGGAKREKMLADLARVREALGRGPVLPRVAEYVYQVAAG
ncbi:MAG: lipid-A-disaccharide synthase [Vulcanimicrobiota bacterium]